MSYTAEKVHPLVLEAEVIEALRSGQSLVINDVAKDPRIAAYVAEYKKIGIGASLTIPFARSGHLNVMLSLSIGKKAISS